MRNENNSIENIDPADEAVIKETNRYMEDRILVWHKESYSMVIYSDIAWLEADRDYCFIHFKDLTKILVVHPMKTLLEELPAELFIRVHRSYTVNLKCVTRLQGNTIYIGKQDFLVSPFYREDLLARFKVLGKVKGLYKSKLVKNTK